MKQEGQPGDPRHEQVRRDVGVHPTLVDLVEGAEMKLTREDGHAEQRIHASPAGLGSEPYTADNLLDRITDRETLEVHYRHVEVRERALLHRRLGTVGGEVLSVGCGWHPGRHLFPSPAF